jgi:tetrahydromethanopterin S-methyltransferase subunit A
MKYWPPPGVTWPVYTSSNLTICINSCHNNVVNDQRKVIDSSGNPTNFPRDAVFANCNHDLSICTQSCLSDMNEFQREAKKEAQHGAQGEVQNLVEKVVEKEIEKEVKEEVAKEVADEVEREAQSQIQEDAQKERN